MDCHPTLDDVDDGDTVENDDDGDGVDYGIDDYWHHSM